MVTFLISITSSLISVWLFEKIQGNAQDKTNPELDAGGSSLANTQSSTEFNSVFASLETLKTQVANLGVQIDNDLGYFRARSAWGIMDVSIGNVFYKFSNDFNRTRRGDSIDIVSLTANGITAKEFGSDAQTNSLLKAIERKVKVRILVSDVFFCQDDFFNNPMVASLCPIEQGAQHTKLDANTKDSLARILTSLHQFVGKKTNANYDSDKTITASDAENFIGKAPDFIFEVGLAQTLITAHTVILNTADTDPTGLVFYTPYLPLKGSEQSIHLKIRKTNEDSDAYSQIESSFKAHWRKSAKLSIDLPNRKFYAKQNESLVQLELPLPPLE
jgi:hypothetical protein